MNVYKYNNDIFISKHSFPFEKANIEELNNAEHIFLLKRQHPKTSTFKSVVSCYNQIDDEESLKYILNEDMDINDNIIKFINEKRISSINTLFNDWQSMYKTSSLKKQYKVNVTGLGDVGGTLCIGLRLLGGNLISEIGIFDLDENKTKRWNYELNQIQYPSSINLPNVKTISYNEIFDCDVFIFCITRSIPDVSVKDIDVRMVQYQNNAEIIEKYANKAIEDNFKGFFFIVSDPVDHLCKKLFYSLNNKNIFLSDNIKGFGLGVMYARAKYYADNLNLQYFSSEGRVFGPHGKDLVVADSIYNYNEDISNKLTKLTVEANIEVRKTGYKPYIAPALSSGALSIISCLKGDWHYSTVKIGDAFLGIKNRLTPFGTEIETYNNININLLNRINSSYERLVKFNV